MLCHIDELYYQIKLINSVVILDTTSDFQWTQKSLKLNTSFKWYTLVYSIQHIMTDFIYSMQFVWVNYQKHLKKMEHTQH